MRPGTLAEPDDLLAGETTEGQKLEEQARRAGQTAPCPSQGDPCWLASSNQAILGTYLGVQGTYHLLSNCTYQPVLMRITLLKELISG